jgi:hypothetical protein
MSRNADHIPAQFDVEFLEWFRERTEATWARLPVRTPKEVLATFVEAGVGGSEWQPGTRWLDGLSEEEISEVELRWNLTCPPDRKGPPQAMGL